MNRDRTEYQKAYRANPEFKEKERLRQLKRNADPEYQQKERIRSANRRATENQKLNEQARQRHVQRMATDEKYRLAKANNALTWVKKNPAKACANAIRRYAQKVNATPQWANIAEIQSFYDLCAALRSIGIDCEVDHIVPIRSPKVCGLHIAENLQIINSLENKSKGNRYWPDMGNG